MTRRYKKIKDISKKDINKIKKLSADHTLAMAAKKLGYKYTTFQYMCKKLGIEFQKYGQFHSTAKHSDHDIWLVRELAKSGVSQRDIAKKMEMSRGYVSHIIRGIYRPCTTTAN